MWLLLERDADRFIEDRWEILDAFQAVNFCKNTQALETLNEWKVKSDHQARS